MPVDEDINLDNPDGLTDDDIRKLEAQAEDLVKLAEQAEAAAEKIEKVVQPMKGLNFAQLESLQKILGKDGQGSLENVEGSGMYVTKDELSEMVIEIWKALEKQKTTNDEQEKEIDEVKKKVNEFKEKIGTFDEIKGEALSFSSNPTGFAKGKAMQFLGKAGLYGVIAQFTIGLIEEMYGQIVSEIKGWFKAGGIYDRRKLVEDALKEYSSLQHVTRIKSGQVYFTADTSKELYQGVPRGADNTRGLRDGHLRFLQTHFDE